LSSEAGAAGVSGAASAEAATGAALGSAERPRSAAGADVGALGDLLADAVERVGDGGAGGVVAGLVGLVEGVHQLLLQRLDVVVAQVSQVRQLLLEVGEGVHEGVLR
jgi:hypothetical protein